ncbi:unnamed protein product [Orchesella dallaii]|uniref:Uncharacterized protein n=1 Tax=Orchesella dallaii TaxID=48710 RepID=A0ABP1RQ53_9HEXA
MEKKHKDLQDKVEVLESANSKLTKELVGTKDQVLRLQEHINANYLIINGVKEHVGETNEEAALKVDEIIGEDLNLPYNCSSARRLGKPSPDNNRPRPIRAYFLSQTDRFAVLATKKKTKEGVFIGPDYPISVRKVRKVLLDKKKEAEKQKCRVNILWSTYEIIIDGLKYHWTEIQNSEDTNNRMEVVDSQ